MVSTSTSMFLFSNHFGREQYNDKKKVEKKQKEVEQAQHAPKEKASKKPAGSIDNPHPVTDSHPSLGHEEKKKRSKPRPAKTPFQWSNYFVLRCRPFLTCVHPATRTTIPENPRKIYMKFGKISLWKMK